MRTVKFIKGLVVEERPVGSGEEMFRYYQWMEPLSPAMGEFMAAKKEEVPMHLVPIHSIFKNQNGVTDELYIAYSRDVERFLGEPYQALYDRVQMMERQLNESRRNASDWCSKYEKIICASWWRRLFKCYK